MDIETGQPVKKTRAQRKFKTPAKRNKCANCLHRIERKNSDQTLLFCLYDGLKTQPDSICDEYKGA